MAMSNTASAQPGTHAPIVATSNVVDSELDKLFAKLITPSPSAAALPAANPTPSKSVNDLFATLTGGGPAAQPAPPPVCAPLQVPEPPPSRGRALLNSIFASALPPTMSASATLVPTTQPLPSQPEEIVIVSPKPTSSALPQILNQDVISSLLGLSPDSRASSAAPSSTGSRRSALHRYEGDNEFSEGDQTSEGEFSRPQVSRVGIHGPHHHVPSLAVPPQYASESEVQSGVKLNGTRRIQGDVTPRPAPGGARLPPASPPQFQQQRTATPTANGKSVNGQGSTTASSAPAAANARARNLVPFEANSDLWPYPRAPLDDRSFEQDDVVELDFSDTRALSDPAVFSTRLKEKKTRREKGRKGRKEREREKEHEKAQIEQGWDLPTQAQVQPIYELAATGPVAAAARIQSPAQFMGPGAKSPSQTKKATNGTNGHVSEGVLDASAAKEAVLTAMSLKTTLPAHAAMSRNDFKQQLQALIYVSKLPIFICTLDSLIL